MNDQLTGLLGAEADTVLQRAVIIPFKCTDKSMIPKRISVESITISPLMVGTIFRLKPFIVKIEKEDLDKMAINDKRNFDPGAPELFAKYADLILNILTIAIHNQKSDPPVWYKTMLAENCTWSDLHVLFNAVIYRLGTMSFYKSTMVAMNMGLMDATGMIALQKNLKSWTDQ